MPEKRAEKESWILAGYTYCDELGGAKPYSPYPSSRAYGACHPSFVRASAATRRTLASSSMSA